MPLPSNGPWTVSEHAETGFAFTIYDRDGWSIAYVTGTKDPQFPSAKHTRAKAVLAAAAPNLAAALQKIVDLQGKLANGRPLSENELRDWAIANHNARAALREAGLDET
jgi:hypothetical protein